MLKNKTSTKIKRVKPELAGGFRDYGSGDAILRQRLLEKIRKTFEDFGFDPMETPAVERTEVLLGGEKESGKIIFNVNSSISSEYKEKDKLSLRFDMTVPLARFLAANPEIPKPLKRYQIGNVWRGESPQAGRYREFLQADIDIAGASSPDADAEIITAIWKTFKNLGLNKFIIKINSRKVLNGLPKYAGFPEKKLPELLRLVDKKEKNGEEALKKELKKTFKEKIATKILEIIAISEDTKTRLMKAREILGGNTMAEEGLNELIEIARNLNASGVAPENWEIDFSVARGLGYYTGSVFETYLTDAKELGSVASGGRYDLLTIPFTGQKLPIVGGSIGVDRLYAAFEKLNLLKKKQTSVKVIVLNLLPELKKDYLALSQVLRAANINTSFYLGDDRAFQAQLAYAVKMEIPYVVIMGGDEDKRGTVTIKNLVTREQKEIPKEKIVEYFRK